MRIETERLIVLATEQHVDEITNLVQCTVKEVYPKYYRDEVVNFFCKWHSREKIQADVAAKKVYIITENDRIVATGTADGEHITRIYVLPDCQGRGYGSAIMDFLEQKIIKENGAAWVESSLPAGKFYHSRGYVTKEHQEFEVENGKILEYEVMRKTELPINPEIYNAPSVLVSKEMELQGINIDELRKIFPKRLYLLADSLYDKMLEKNVGTLTYHVGGEVYVMNSNKNVGFVKSEMCAPGLATQAEDLYAAGAQELIHVGFAGGHNGTKIGDYVVTDGAYTDAGIPKLYGVGDEFVPSTKELTDALCEELKAKGLEFHRGCHWTTDAGYVEPEWRILYYARKGSLCVEMEGAGLFTIAKFRSRKATAIYVISDSGSSDDWTLGWGEEVLEKSIDRLIERLVNI